MQSKYTTKEKVLARVTTTLTDPEIENIISLVSGYIDTFLGYKLATDYGDTASNFLLDGSGTEYLMLSQPVYAYTSVDYVALDDSVTPVSYVASYPLNATYTAYLAMKIGTFRAGMGNYRLTGAKLGRFSVDWTDENNHTLDNAVTEVCTSICVAMINAGGFVIATSGGEIEKSGKVTAETIGSYSVQYQNNPATQRQLISSVPTATDILDKYKIISIA
jgi:hypothetical protein